VAVRAHELALRQFVQNKSTAAAFGKNTDLADLFIPGKVVPMHDRAREALAAVRTGHIPLQVAHPRADRGHACALSLAPGRPTSLLVIAAVVLATAVAAVRELTGPRVVEVGL
jgi:hypothetical protein